MSRNGDRIVSNVISQVTPRERRVSRNAIVECNEAGEVVTPRERRVSRNSKELTLTVMLNGHASREACE